MVRNRIVLLVLMLALAAASFGFTSSPALGLVTHQNFPKPFCPPGFEPVRHPFRANGDHFVTEAGIRFKCVKINGAALNDTPFIQANLAAVKVSPELAGVLALFEQPAGTVVANVSQLYTGTIPPYYEVTLVYGNYVKSVYIDARNGNILPPQDNHPVWLWNFKLPKVQ